MSEMSQTEHARVGKPALIDKPYQLYKRNYLLSSPVIIRLVLLFIFSEFVDPDTNRSAKRLLIKKKI